MMKFQFELRSKTFPSKTWNNTIDFCIDHDIFIPHEYQKVILEIASEHGVYRKLTLLDDKKGMLLSASLPSYELFSEWLAKRIDYFHKVKNSEIFEDSDEIPYFPNSFQKKCWDLTNFSPLIPYNAFWKSVNDAFDIAKHECKINLKAFNANTIKAYYEFYT